MDPAKFKSFSERYEKENRNVKLVEEFVESYQEAPITGKFYARHEAITIPEHIPEEYAGLVEKIDEEINYKRSSIPPRPSTVNHEYGWFTKPLIPRSTDPRLYFPLKHCEFIAEEIKRRAIEKKKAKEKASGVPLEQ